MKFTKSYKEIITILLLLAVFAAAMFLLSPNTTAIAAKIEHDCETVATVMLRGETQTYTLPADESVVLEYGETGIRFISSDCPDKLCIHAGNLSHAGEIAACLPNDVIVTVVGEGTDVTVG